MKLKSKLHQTVELLALRHFCNKVISVSEEARKFYLKISNLLPQNLLTIYNGIDLSHFEHLNHQQDRAKIREEFGLPARAKILITVAVLREFKGIQYMIRALPAVVAKDPDVYYLVVGNGTYREALEKEVEQAGMKDHVVFAGQRSDIPHLRLSAMSAIASQLGADTCNVVFRADRMRCRLSGCLRQRILAAGR